MNPVLTAVSPDLSLSLRLLFLLPRGLPLLSRISEVSWLLALLLLRASQLSSPTQKQVIRAVRAAMDFGFFLTEVAGEPLIPDAMFEGR